LKGDSRVLRKKPKINYANAKETASQPVKEVKNIDKNARGPH